MSALRSTIRNRSVNDRSMRSFSLVLLLLFVLGVSLIVALSSSNPSWSPTIAYSNDTLNCSWQVGPDVIEQNVTILNGSAIYYFANETGSFTTSHSIAGNIARRDQIWTCRIWQNNGTNTQTQETSITIQNSAPLTPTLYNGSQSMGSVVQVSEGQSYSFTLNSSDPVDTQDNPTLYYYIDPRNSTSFCSVTGGGAVTCTPTHVDVRLSSSNQLENLTQTKLTFWVQDANPNAKASSLEVTFNITPMNAPPVVLVFNRTTPVNTSLNTTFTASDEETNYPLIYRLNAPAQIASALSIVPLNAQGTSVSVYYDASIIDYSRVGSWQVQINVTDNSTNYTGQPNNASALYNFTLNITAVGRPPYFTNVTTNITGWPVGVISMLQGQSVQLNFSANDPDANSTLTLLWQNSTNGTKGYFAISTYKRNNSDGADIRAQANFTASNADVGVYNVTIIAQDLEGLTNSTLLQFNVTNVNDAPILYEMSYASSLPSFNSNMSNLSAFANTPFLYTVNATDPDIIYGDVLTFSTNSTIFVINSSTGTISFTPNNSIIAGSPYSILVTVQDLQGASASRVMSITVLANTPPNFNATIGPLQCSTKSLCRYTLANSTHDAEDGTVSLYNITFLGSTPANFSYNTTSGLINFTVPKIAVGNYTMNITIFDSVGAQASTLVNLSIINIPEPPILIHYNLSSKNIVETHTISYELQATDEDLLLPSLGENIAFNINLTGKSSSLNATITPLPNNGTLARALLSFTPAIGDAGNYTVQINATDIFGNVDRKFLTFEILQKANSPNITNVTPWGVPPLYALQTSYADASLFPSRLTGIVFNESNTITYGVIANDPTANIDSYVWTMNGTVVGSNSSNYMFTYDYFSSGDYLVQVNVSNDRYEYSTFSWHVSVSNMNRAPKFLHNLSSLSLNRTTTITGYFYNYYTDINDPGIRFIDPDDDLNSNGVLDGNETNRLTFSTPDTCQYASVSASGADLSVDPLAVGTCIFHFVGMDPQGAFNQSNAVQINVTSVPGATPTPLQSSGGGGGSSSPTVVPITKKLVTPKAFNLIAPKLVTIYNNKSVSIPITINNTWMSSLKMLNLRAESNATEVNMSFDQNFFEEVPANQSREVQLIITNYRLGGDYEVKVIANTTEPSYQDSALILLNSIEASKDGEEMRVKVTFANDLINDHPECLELNEILSQAKERVNEGNIAEGSRLVDSVINGCKYLVSMKENVQEKPSKLNPIISIDELTAKSIMIGALIFVVLCSIVFVIFYHYTHKAEDDI